MEAFFIGILAGTAIGTIVAVAMVLARPARRSRPWTWPQRTALVASAFGAGAGIAIIVAGDSPLFAAWWRGFAAAFGPHGEVDAARHARALAWFVPIGLVIVAHYLVVAYAVWARAPRWAGRVGAWSVGAWFVVDSTSGLVTGGGFNVLLINVPALVVGLPAYLWLARTPA